MRDDDESFNSGAPASANMVGLLRKLKSAGKPITLSINGQGKLEVADDESFRLALALIDRLETIEGIKEGVRFFEEGGKGFTWEQIHEEIQRKYGTPI